MKLLSPYELVADDGARYVRTPNTLELETPRHATLTLYGADAQRIWSDLLRAACLRVGLPEDASIHEIRGWLEQQGG